MAEQQQNPPVVRNPPLVTGAGEANAYRDVKFVVEFATRQNNYVACPITRRLYRGRWDPINVKGRQPDDRFATCPVIPGLRIQFDGVARRVSVLDPLADPKFREVLREARAAVKSMWGHEPEPDEPAVFERLTDDVLKAWAYWCRRWLDQGAAERVSGAVPEMDDLTNTLPGRVERNTFETSARRDKFPADVPPYIPPGKAARVS